MNHVSRRLRNSVVALGLAALIAPAARAQTPIFKDGFEMGDHIGWSDSTQPGARAFMSGYQWHPDLDDKFVLQCNTHGVPNHQGQFTFHVEKDGAPYLTETVAHSRNLAPRLPPGAYEVRCEALNEVTNVETGLSLPYAFNAPETMPQTTVEVEPWFPQNAGRDYSFLCGPQEEMFPGFTGTTNWWVRRPSEPAPWDPESLPDHGTPVPARKHYHVFNEEGPWVVYCFSNEANYTGNSLEYPELGRGSLLVDVNFD